MRDMSRVQTRKYSACNIATNSEFATPEKQVIRELAVTLLHTIFDLQTLGATIDRPR
jgi:hypothetical protein